jgi:hypothetical protein
VGNVGEVPKVSEREREAFVANFPLATNEVWKDKEGEEVRKTEWHRFVVLFVTFCYTDIQNVIQSLGGSVFQTNRENLAFE